MYPAASAAIDLLLTGRKKVIILNHVEMMKLGNLVPNFDSKVEIQLPLRAESI